MKVLKKQATIVIQGCDVQ